MGSVIRDGKDQIEQKPRVGIGVMVVKDGKVLLGKRREGYGHGTWSFPGGHLEFGESWEDCARREVREEAGIEIDHLTFATAVNDYLPEQQNHYVTLYLVANYQSGEATADDQEIGDWDWFEWGRLPRPLFPPVENLLKGGFYPVQLKP